MSSVGPLEPYEGCGNFKTRRLSKSDVMPQGWARFFFDRSCQSGAIIVLLDNPLYTPQKLTFPLKNWKFQPWMKMYLSFETVFFHCQPWVSLPIASTGRGWCSVRLCCEVLSETGRIKQSSRVSRGFGVVVFKVKCCKSQVFLFPFGIRNRVFFAELNHAPPSYLALKRSFFLY